MNSLKFSPPHGLSRLVTVHFEAFLLNFPLLLTRSRRIGLCRRHIRAAQLAHRVVGRRWFYLKIRKLDCIHYRRPKECVEVATRTHARMHSLIYLINFFRWPPKRICCPESCAANECPHIFCIGQRHELDLLRWADWKIKLARLKHNSCIPRLIST
jgi:hypothetical protein